jgi:hypothetical protein
MSGEKVKPRSSERFGLHFPQAGCWTSCIVHAGAAANVDNGDRAQATGTPFQKRVVDVVVAFGAEPGFALEPFLKSRHISICDSTPPTKNATTQVPVQTRSASFHPRSFSITIREAMHGVKSVIVTSATTT